MELAQALEFARGYKQGVLATIRRNDRPQLSNILYAFDDKGVARVSVTDDRAKTRNLRRDPRASLYVPGDTFRKWIVLDGTAELSPVAQAPEDATVEALVDFYRVFSGEHPDWDDYRRAMVADKRLVIHFTPERAYGHVRLIRA